MKIKAIIKLLTVVIILFSCSKEKKSEGQNLNTEDDNDLITYWNEQKKGTNYFNESPTKEWFDAAKKANIKFVRLTYEKWKGEQKDFLLGDADNYKGIVESDFLRLKHFLDYANDLDIKIVVTPISLPGARWVQMNNNIRDDKLWKDQHYREQAIQFWKDLASRLKNHPAVVGYNLVNEPHPEVAYNQYSFWDKGLPEWYQNIKGGQGDLNLFNTQMVGAIRSIDPNIPIIVESGLYATPWAFEYLEPLNDDKVIYSFHMYEPYAFTTESINKDKYSYPGRIFIEELNGDFELNKQGLEEFFNPIIEWSERNQIHSNRIWVGEFGCNRFINGVEHYLSDLISIFNKYQWHWSFYAYREDVWQAMDYELGTEKVFYKYWEYQDSKNLHLNYDDIYKRVKNPSLWKVLSKEFN